MDLIVTNGEEYANELDLSVDYDETGNKDLMSIEEYDTLNKILSCEVAIYVMRRTAGVDGLSIDNMWDNRHSLISEYEKSFEKEYEFFNKGLD